MLEYYLEIDINHCNFALAIGNDLCIDRSPLQ